MDSLDRELKQVEKIGRAAYDLIMRGEFGKANRQLRKLQNSFCVSEAERIRIPLAAFALRCQGRQKEAKDLIKSSISYVWNSPDAFALVRCDNPPANPRSKVLKIEILGGNLIVGAFSSFNEASVATIEVIAESQTEALLYIDELLHFSSPHERRVLSCISTDEVIPAGEHKGVIWLHPIRQMEH